METNNGVLATKLDAKELGKIHARLTMELWKLFGINFTPDKKSRYLKFSHFLKSYGLGLIFTMDFIMMFAVTIKIVTITFTIEEGGVMDMFLSILSRESIYKGTMLFLITAPIFLTAYLFFKQRGNKSHNMNINIWETGILTSIIYVLLVAISLFEIVQR